MCCNGSCSGKCDIVVGALRGFDWRCGRNVFKTIFVFENRSLRPRDACLLITARHVAL
jgi:hypothetical protein